MNYCIILYISKQKHKDINDIIKKITKKHNFSIKYFNKLLHQYLLILLYNISLKTPIEYRANYDGDFKLKITVKKYTTEDIDLDDIKLLRKKLKIIKNYLINDFKNEKLEKKDKHIIRSILKIINKDNLEDLLSIDAVDIKNGNKVIYTERIKTELPKIITERYKIDVLCDKSTIRQFIDPYIENYAIIVDYSKKLEELNYMYNCLHIYEHYITHAWRNNDNNNVVDFNGGTISNGIMNIYTISSSKEDIEKRLYDVITFNIKSSNKSFINDSKVLDLETIRTISETYNNRNITRMGRSDQSAYDINYNIEVFAWWCSLPMNILLITSEEIKLNIDNINAFYKKNHYEAKQPEKPIFDYLPKEVFYTRTNLGYYTYKKDTKKIISKIYKNIRTTSLYGIDNRMVSYDSDYEKNDISITQSFVHALLSFANLVDRNVIDNYISKTVFPNNTEKFDLNSNIITI